MGGAKSRFTRVEKEEIVAEAYSKAGNVKAPGRLYGVPPNSICYWAKTIQEAGMHCHLQHLQKQVESFLSLQESLQSIMMVMMHSTGS
jgi:transposase-like protein